MKTGVQLYSVRDNVVQDFEGTLKAVAEMGYDGVEFAGLAGLSAAEVKALCEKYNLEPISAHVPFADLVEKTEETLDTYAAIGCKYVVLPYMPVDHMPTKPNFPAFKVELERIGAAARKRGIVLLYHNHNFEFFKAGGEWGLDLLYKEVSADVLQTEIDTCWANIGGVVPADYVRKYKGRAPIVHLKDFHQEGASTGKLFDLIGIDDDDADAPKKDSSFQFRPVGMGLQDIPAILAASAEAGAGWVIVEQDAPALDMTPMESIKASIDYLKTQQY